jgi:hypothetical protein
MTESVLFASKLSSSLSDDVTSDASQKRWESLDSVDLPKPLQRPQKDFLRNVIHIVGVE